jgi:hypothetical protein
MNTMNRSIATYLVVAVAATFAAAAQADDIGVETTPFTSTATRAQVQAELQQFKQARVNPWSQFHNPLASFRSTATRADVTADYLRSRDETAALTAEDSGSAWLSTRAPYAAPPVVAGQPVTAQ